MDHSLLRDVGIAIVGAGLMGMTANRIKIPLILAYLGTGVILGPHLGLGMIKDNVSINLVSEIGLILLMFILGMEIDVKKLLQAGKAVMINGVTQFLGCALLAVGLFYGLGFRNGGDNFELVYLAVTASLSSTLIVVKILSDRQELDSLTSRITLGILVIQDLWAVAFLALQPNLHDFNTAILLFSLCRGLILIASTLFVAKFILPKVFFYAAKQPELMMVVSMGWCFMVAGLASLLGLSIEMGALIAGVSVASFPYHIEMAVKVSSLRDFFITLFFVGLGLQIPVPNAEVMYLAMGIVLFSATSRILTIFPVLRLLKYGNRSSLLPGINLGQVSEFSLVLVALGVQLGHVRPYFMSAFIVALVITTLISSLLIPHNHRLYRLMNPILEFFNIKDTMGSENQDEESGAHHDHPIVVLGFFREASSLLTELGHRHTSEKIKSEVQVIDYNPESIRKLSKMGITCKFGDISHMDTLEHLHLEHAKVVICTIPDHLLKGTSNLKLLRALKKICPEARIIVTAETIEMAEKMYGDGADYVFLPRMVGAQFLADILDGFQSGKLETIKDNSRVQISANAKDEILP